MTTLEFSPQSHFPIDKKRMEIKGVKPLSTGHEMVLCAGVLDVVNGRLAFGAEASPLVIPAQAGIQSKASSVAEKFL